jgi:hypothetical protein
MTARLLLQILYHGSSTSSSDTHQKSSPSTRTLLGRSSSSSNHHHQGTASHVQFLLSNHVLHIEYVPRPQFAPSFPFIVTPSHSQSHGVVWCTQVVQCIAFAYIMNFSLPAPTSEWSAWLPCQPSLVRCLPPPLPPPWPQFAPFLPFPITWCRVVHARCSMYCLHYNGYSWPRWL